MIQGLGSISEEIAASSSFLPVATLVAPTIEKLPSVGPILIINGIMGLWGPVTFKLHSRLQQYQRTSQQDAQVWMLTLQY